MAKVELKIKALHPKVGKEIPLPKIMSAGAAGMDVAAAVDAPITIDIGARALIPCGFSMALPLGYEAQLRPRSGLAMRHGLTLPNAPGTIDADYRGEVKVILMNCGQEPFVVESGMRIAQMVVMPMPFVEVSIVEDLVGSERGEGGFGSTGV